MTDHHLSRRDADRILDAPAESGRPVAEVLEALRAPVTADELRREDAAVTAFHVARLAPSPRSRRGMSPTTPRTAAVRALAATGLVVALTSGGFALAATGHLPTLPDQASDTATEAVARHSTSPSESPSETVTEDATTSDEATDDLEATQGAPGDSTEATESTDEPPRPARGTPRRRTRRRPHRPPASRACARPSRPATRRPTARPSTTRPSPRWPPRPAARTASRPTA